MKHVIVSFTPAEAEALNYFLGCTLGYPANEPLHRQAFRTAGLKYSAATRAANKLQDRIACAIDSAAGSPYRSFTRSDVPAASGASRGVVFDEEHEQDQQ